MTLKRTLTYTFILFIVMLFSFRCYAKTYKYDVELPVYLQDGGSVNSIVCSIDSTVLKHHTKNQHILFEGILDNFNIDSGLDKFQFVLSKDGALELIIPEPDIDLTNASIKNKITQNEELDDFIINSILSFKKRIKLNAKLIGYEIERAWLLIGSDFSNIDGASFTHQEEDGKLRNITIHDFESSKLPIKYSEWLRGQDDERNKILELNIEYQHIGSHHIPQHIVNHYFAESESIRSYDLEFYNCKIE